MPRTIIVSNRLPVKIKRKGKELVYEPSEGGLATGLGSIYKHGDNLWIGWPGTHLTGEQEKQRVMDHLRRGNMHPVFITKNEIREYYEGFSNETLWPMFHYFSQYAVYNQRYWDTYIRVNQKFCDAIMGRASQGDTIWIHDYQLLLLPSMLRSRLPDARIGFFQHIPFPSYEIFRLLPWRRQLLEGMLGADLVGFHTYDDMRHFLSAVNRIAGLSSRQGMVDVENRTVMIDAFPMGIDYDTFARAASSPAVKKREKRYRREIGTEKIILSIDRLDYSKGIPQRLKAFRLFLERYPEFHEKVSLLMQVIPSRDKVTQYRTLKEEVDELVGGINSEFRTIAWTPIQYFYRSFPFETLSALYRMADVALVTPMRDGMNLVCKEYIASRTEGRGVLVLSEMAGASKELSDALLINPNDIGQMAEALHTALTMPVEEQAQHIAVMQKTLRRYTITHWVDLFMNRLAYVREQQHRLSTRAVDRKVLDLMRRRYAASRCRLIFLDYDGTLTPFHDKPDKARPDSELLAMLHRLSSDERNRVVIISGRDRASLTEWLGELRVDIIAEHGVWFRTYNEGWQMIQTLQNDWKDTIRPIFEGYVDRTPGSLIEEKDYSLVWHYRRVETGLGEMRARELMSHLEYLISNTQLQVLEGDKVVEIKNVEVNKGTAALQWVERHVPDFILAVGDDRTDEDIFHAMPPEAFTVKVGTTRSRAQYHVLSYAGVRALLTELAGRRTRSRTQAAAAV